MPKTKPTPKKKSHRGLIVLFVVLFIITIGLALKIFYFDPAAKRAKEPLSVDEKLSAVESAIDWLGSSDQTFDSRSVWALSEINKTCEREDLGDVIKVKKEAALTYDDLQPAYNVLFDPTYEFSYVEEDLQDLVNNPLDQVLIPALYCAESDVTDVTMDILESLSDEGGYSSTGALLATTWLEERSCGNQEWIGEISDARADEIVGAQNSDKKYSDLYGERIAMLGYAGMENRIAEEWITKLVKAQESDGGWVFKDISSKDSNYHATIYALWGLVEHLGKCE